MNESFIHSFETFIHSCVRSRARVVRSVVRGTTRSYYSVLVVQTGRRDADASPHAAEETTERLGHLDALGDRMAAWADAELVQKAKQHGLDTDFSTECVFASVLSPRAPSVGRDVSFTWKYRTNSGKESRRFRVDPPLFGGKCFVCAVTFARRRTVTLFCCVRATCCPGGHLCSRSSSLARAPPGYFAVAVRVHDVERSLQGEDGELERGAQIQRRPFRRRILDSNRRFRPELEIFLKLAKRHGVSIRVDRVKDILRPSQFLRVIDRFRRTRDVAPDGEKFPDLGIVRPRL